GPGAAQPASSPPVLAVSQPQLITQLGHMTALIAVAFSRDGRMVLTTGDDTAILWDVASGRELRRFQHEGRTRLNSVALSPDARLVATADFSEKDQVRIWDARTGKELRRLSGHSSAVDIVRFSLDGRYVLTGGQDETVRAWDASAGDEILSFSFEEGPMKQ